MRRRLRAPRPFSAGRGRRAFARVRGTCRTRTLYDMPVCGECGQENPEGARFVTPAPRRSPRSMQSPAKSGRSSGSSSPISSALPDARSSSTRRTCAPCFRRTTGDPRLHRIRLRSGCVGHAGDALIERERRRRLVATAGGYAEGSDSREGEEKSLQRGSDPTARARPIPEATPRGRRTASPPSRVRGWK